MAIAREKGMTMPLPSINSSMRKAGVARLSAATVDKLVLAAKDKSRIDGLTHKFYRYPARFSPILVRAAIEAFTEQGDTVLDPFMGGGTTLVEALATGRRGVGADISALAAFVSGVKTTLYDDSEFEQLTFWVENIASKINIRDAANSTKHYEEAGYYRQLDNAGTWRIRKAIDQALSSAVLLNSETLEAFARCVILRTAQWALDGRKQLPKLDQFRLALTKYGRNMLVGAQQLRVAANAFGLSATSIHCLNRSIEGLEVEESLHNKFKPRLVITSPPYPGVHVLYHRWQVNGRKETPAPFWIANKLDGDGSAYYTMGGRHTHKLNTYFEKLAKALRSVVAVCDEKTTIVQVVAFSEPAWQLPRYLAVADDVGLVEELLPGLDGDGRLWRGVPNRKWHAEQAGATAGSQEVVLFHRLKLR